MSLWVLSSCVRARLRPFQNDLVCFNFCRNLQIIVSCGPLWGLRYSRCYDVPNSPRLWRHVHRYRFWLHIEIWRGWNAFHHLRSVDGLSFVDIDRIVAPLKNSFRSLKHRRGRHLLPIIFISSSRTILILALIDDDNFILRCIFSQKNLWRFQNILFVLTLNLFGLYIKLRNLV